MCQPARRIEGSASSAMFRGALKKQPNALTICSIPANPVSPKMAKVATLTVPVFHKFVSCLAITASCMTFLNSAYMSNGGGQNRHVQGGLLILANSWFCIDFEALGLGMSKVIWEAGFLLDNLTAGVHLGWLCVLFHFRP